MKKLLIVCTVSLIADLSYAQFNKGRILVSGSASISHKKMEMKLAGQNSEMGSQTSLVLSPKGSYFLIDNLALGLGFIFSNQTTKYKDLPEKVKSKSFLLAPNVRYYFLDKFFLHGEFAFGVGKESNQTGGDDDSESKITTAQLGLGYVYFLSDHVALEPVIGYSLSKTKLEVAQSPTFLTKDLFCQVGISVYLGD